MSRKILFAGESWMSYTTHVKGFDSFTTSVYQEGATKLIEGLRKDGFDVEYIPNHVANVQIPSTIEGLAAYDAVVLSDIGSNTLLLPDCTFIGGKTYPNRCELLKQYVLDGGGLLMIGGYMSFCGIDGKARYGSTAVGEVLPVTCFDVDDRRENCQGVSGKIVKDHAIFDGMSGKWPTILGYNKTLKKDGCEILAEVEGDPLIAIGEFGKGKSAVYTSDCSPHWGTQEFMDWAHYSALWKNILEYIAR